MLIDGDALKQSEARAISRFYGYGTTVREKVGLS